MKNKLLILLVFLLNLTAYTQNRDPHKHINEFFKELSTAKHYKIKKINHNKLKWTHEDMHGSNDLYISYGILKNDSIQKYLAPSDLTFIEEQYKSLYGLKMI